MNLIARYGNSSIDITGSAENLRALASELRQPRETAIPLLVPNGPATPYDDYATSILIECGSGAACVSMDAREIMVVGSHDNLIILAKNIEWFADQEGHAPPGWKNDHMHIEYYPDHSYLSPKSIPLVLTRHAQIKS